MTSNTPSNPPSSRPMTLRQQVDELRKSFAIDVSILAKYHPIEEVGQRAFDNNRTVIERLCQEIVREARLNMVDYFDQVPRNDLMDWKGLFADTRRLLLEEEELTQKPPQPPQGGLEEVSDGSS